MRAMRAMRAVRTVGAVRTMRSVRGMGVEPALDAIQARVGALQQVIHAARLARLLALLGLHEVGGLAMDRRELVTSFHGETPIRRIVLWAESVSNGGRSCRSARPGRRLDAPVGLPQLY